MAAARPSHEESSLSGRPCHCAFLPTCPAIGRFGIPDECPWEPRKSPQWVLELRKEVCYRKSLLIHPDKPCRSLAAGRPTVSYIWEVPSLLCSRSLPDDILIHQVSRAPAHICNRCELRDAGVQLGDMLRLPDWLEGGQGGPDGIKAPFLSPGAPLRFEGTSRSLIVFSPTCTV